MGYLLNTVGIAIAKWLPLGCALQRVSGRSLRCSLLVVLVALLEVFLDPHLLSRQVYIAFSRYEVKTGLQQDPVCSRLQNFENHNLLNVRLDK